VRDVTADDDRLNRVRQARRTLSESGPATVRARGDFDRVAVPAVDGDALRDVLIADQARVVIEIGLAYGASALAVAEALASSGFDATRHVIIDAFQDHFDDVGWNGLVDAGLADTSVLLRERSQLVLPRLVGDGFVADAAFVDGSHVFHNVFVDLAFLSELVRPGGLVILDDCQWPSVATAVRYFEINMGWLPQPINEMTRLRAYRLPDPRIDVPFESFQPFDMRAEP
jgi:predicted O-methyltransferase YrrM